MRAPGSRLVRQPAARSSGKPVAGQPVHATDEMACNTGPMGSFTISTNRTATDAEVLALYGSVGWVAYTNDPDLLFQALRCSAFVVAARNQDGMLIGLARTVSDDATICYLQDILVHPEAQGTGVGRALFDEVKQRYGHVRQMVLITDDEPQQRAFYEAMGLREGSDFDSGPVRLFARFR